MGKRVHSGPGCTCELQLPHLVSELLNFISHLF